VYEDPVITFSIKEKINTELFIDRMAALQCTGDSSGAMANEGDQPFSTS